MSNKRLKSGTDVHYRGEYEWTPLIYAAFYGLTNKVRRLLQRGAEIEARDRFGRTALLLAVGNHANLEVVRELLKWGADVNTRDDRGETPLCHALKNLTLRDSKNTHYPDVPELVKQNGRNIVALLREAGAQE